MGTIQSFDTLFRRDHEARLPAGVRIGDKKGRVQVKLVFWLPVFCPLLKLRSNGVNAFLLPPPLQRLATFDVVHQPPLRIRQLALLLGLPLARLFEGVTERMFRRFYHGADPRS